MKILITNTVALNVGDAAILKGAIKLLQFTFGADTEFVIYDNQPEAAQKYYPNLKFRRLMYLQGITANKFKHPARPLRFLNRLRVKFALNLWNWNLPFFARAILINEEWETLLEYKDADLVVSTGGTYLVEDYFLYPRIFDYEMALLLKRPLMFFTQSLGPFHLPYNQRIFKQIFNQSPLILLRDFRSQNHLLTIDVLQNNMHVVPDTAFALSDPIAIAKSQKISHLPISPKIAISVRKWTLFKTIDPVLGQEKYLRAIRDLTIHLVDHYQAKITFVSTCQGIPEYALDDSDVALEIFRELPSNIAKFVTVNQEFHPPEELAKLLKNYDMAIATRLHMAILSLGAGVPVLPIAYEFKTKELFSKLGQGKWAVDIEEIESESLIDLADQFLAQFPEICRDLFPFVQQEQEKIFATSSLIKQVHEEFQKSVSLKS